MKVFVERKWKSDSSVPYGYCTSQSDCNKKVTSKGKYAGDFIFSKRLYQAVVFVLLILGIVILCTYEDELSKCLLDFQELSCKSDGSSKQCGELSKCILFHENDWSLASLLDSKYLISLGPIVGLLYKAKNIVREIKMIFLKKI